MKELTRLVHEGELEHAQRRSKAEEAVDRELVYRLKAQGYKPAQIIERVFDEHGRLLTHYQVRSDYRIARREMQDILGENVSQWVHEEIQRISIKEDRVWGLLRAALEGNVPAKTTDTLVRNDEGELELSKQIVSKDAAGHVEMLLDKLVALQDQRLKAIGVESGNGLIQLNVGSSVNNAPTQNVQAVVGFSPEEWDKLRSDVKKKAEDVIEGEIAS